MLSEVLDFLFLPNFGASLHWLKVEIGGEALATEGSEASHARSLQELQRPNYDRGYEWRLMAEARRRNPAIGLYGLSWTWPGFLAGSSGGSSPWSDTALTANYSISWVRGAERRHGLRVDVLGVWNERPFSAEYVKRLRAGLDAAGFRHTAILCDDGKYSCAAAMLSDAHLMAAVSIVGGHGPPTPQAVQTGKPLWFSEDFHSHGGEAGGAVWAAQLNGRYLLHNMTATLAWNAVDAFYPGLAFDNTGLMTARCPWSGQYEVLATVWATAHTTQFSRPGWHFLPVGGGSGLLREGGSFVTYVERGDRANFSIVVEKFSGDGGQVSAETVGFCLAGSLRWAVGTPLSVWSSSFHSGGPASYLERAAPISPDARGCFNLSVPVNSLWTVTTLASGGRGSHPPPAACADFPLPYASSFESCLPPAEADYFSDVSGSWECVADGGSHGVVMRLQTPARPVSWEPAADGSPLGVFGQRDWADISVTLDVRLNGASDSFMLAVRANLRNATDHAALELEYVWPGLWLAWDTAGHWRLTDQANHGAVLASGSLPVVPSAGSWHTFALSACGDGLSASMDGVSFLRSLNVSLQFGSGWLGYGCTGWGQQPDFDDILVEPTSCSARASAE